VAFQRKKPRGLVPRRHSPASSNRNSRRQSMGAERGEVDTRRGNDWTNRFRKIAADAWHINAGSAIIDGEVLVPAADGTGGPAQTPTSQSEKRSALSENC
jgi:hypothetical protein